jgi:2,4-dienoyl-CoA reductase-like NADH-dependent reductase (Old Yellow Enzyme family)
MLATGPDWGATLSATPSGQAQSEMRELMTPQLFTPLTARSGAPPEPHRGRADVPVLGRRRLRHGLAPAASHDARDVGRRPRDARGDRGRARRPHHPWLPRALSDDNERALGRALAAARAVALPGTKFGIQISHAGRKGSAQRPWEGGRALAGDDDPWSTQAPSALPFDEGWPVPDVLTEADIDRIRDGFVRTTQRAARLGIEVVELHMAHGYLMHQFQSPLSNRREDAWGGDVARRSAFALGVARAVRDAAPKKMAVGARITGTDWTEDGITPDDAAAFARALKQAGLDFVCVTSGGVALKAKIPLGPGYQVPLAAKVRRESGILTRAVGLIADPHQAETILARGEADQVALARAFLDNPRWGWHAAEALGVELAYPPQYARAKAAVWPGAKIARGADDPAPERLRA